MKIRWIFIACTLSWFSTASAAETGSIEERVRANEVRALAAQEILLSRSQLINLCRGLEAVRWCEGYIAGMLTSLQVPRNSDCLPMTDVAPFMYGNVWELTLEWLYQQPENSEMRLYDAIYTAMSEQEQCEI